MMSTITDVSTGLYGISNEETLEDATRTFDELEPVHVHPATPLDNYRRTQAMPPLGGEIGR